MDQKSVPNRPIGVHLRLHEALDDIITGVQTLHLPVAQSFLLTESGKYVNFSEKNIAHFVHQKKQLNFLYFVHAAYWSGLIDITSKEFFSLCKETDMASRLASDGIVIHPGATRTRMEKKDQAKYVAQGVNELLHQVAGINLILENSPHLGRNFGGDITDFALLLEHIEDKNRVQFCIDSAHAFVFGYDFLTEKTLQSFVQLVTDCLAGSTVALLHMNDASEHKGSMIDKHEIPGKGIIGAHALSLLMNHAFFDQVPIIIEMPSHATLHDAQTVIHEMRLWTSQ